jgi:HEAT repeat protein
MGDLLLRALEDPEERVWHASIRHLIALRGRHLGSLWRAIRGTSPVKREEIVRAIESTDPDLLSELAMAYADQDDRSARALALEIAARAGTPECRARVIAALEDPDPLVRRAAAVSMSTVRTAAAVSALARSLSDPQVEVRVEVVRALSLIDDNEVLPVLISALKDPEVRVRDMAAEALARWRSPGVSRRLAAALSEPDLRRAARDLLERMGEAAVEPLVGIVLGDDREAARLAGELLERVAGPHPFVAALSSVDPGQRLRSVEVLGAMGDPTASEALLTTLSDPDERVRVRAIELLGELGDPRAIDPLRRAFLSDPVVRVAVAAEETLRRLGSPPTLPQETAAHGFAGFADEEPSSGSEGRPENEHQNET